MSETDNLPDKSEKKRSFKPSNFLGDWHEDGLSSEEVFVGLLDHGIFADKVPPCFTSKGLAAFVGKTIAGLLDEVDEQKLIKNLNRNSHDFIRYEALRDINIPRHLGIPHPESYSVQALAIKSHWDEIKTHCNKPSPSVSRIYVRYVGDGSIFKMNYKGSERYQLEEDEIEWNAGAQFIVKADISACFASIYTHSIPWALHGKDIAKKDHSIKKYAGNLLDRCSQNTRDKQTNGLLIGPHASNIISEVVLTSVDRMLQSKRYTKFYRHIDDYTFYADTYQQAEDFLKDLGLSLRAYEMSINEKKTRILPLPRPSTENWIQELNRFVFPLNDDVLRFSSIRSFLDLAIGSAQTAGTSAPLNYAIQMLADNQNHRPLNERAKRLYVQEAINLALAYPYLTPILDKFVFDRYWYEGIKEKISAFATSLVDLGIRKLYPDTIAHALYYVLRHDLVLSIDESQFLKIIEIDDCLANVLVYEYSIKYKLKNIQKAIKNRATELKTADPSEKDQHWLLIYQSWSASDLKKHGQTFLSDLKVQEFKFLAMPPSKNS